MEPPPWSASKDQPQAPAQAEGNVQVQLGAKGLVAKKRQPHCQKQNLRHPTIQFTVPYLLL